MAAIPKPAIRSSPGTPVACLAPDIVAAIVQGRQPATLTHRTLLAANLPLDGAAQRIALGAA